MEVVQLRQCLGRVIGEGVSYPALGRGHQSDMVVDTGHGTRLELSLVHIHLRTEGKY